MTAPSTQRACKAKRTDSSGSEDSQRPRKQPCGDQPSRLGTGLPVVPGKSEAIVLALVRAGKCANCEEKGHHANVCPRQVPAFVAAAVGLPSPLPAQAAALPAEALSLHGPAPVDALPKAGKQFALLQKRTKNFDMLVDCIVHASKLTSQSVRDFLDTSSHKDHALIDASTCTAHEARSLILHVVRWSGAA